MSCRSLLLLSILSCLVASGQEPSNQLTFVLVNGKTGKPVPGAKLLVEFQKDFTASSRYHGEELRVDGGGRASFPLGANLPAYLQVFVNFMTLCELHPNQNGFAVAAILAHGVQTPNNCGKVSLQPQPGELVVYARESSLREKMDW